MTVQPPLPYLWPDKSHFLDNPIYYLGDSREQLGRDIVRLINAQGDALATLDDQVATLQGQVATLQSQVATLEQLGRGCFVINSADQNVLNNTNTVLSFDIERFDTDNMHDPAVPNHLTIQTVGLYVMGASAQWDGGSSVGFRALWISLNSTPIAASNNVPANPHQQTVTGVYRCNVGWTVEANVIQNSGATRVIQAASEWSPTLWAVRIGP